VHFLLCPRLIKFRGCGLKCYFDDADPELETWLTRNGPTNIKECSFEHCHFTAGKAISFLRVVPHLSVLHMLSPHPGWDETEPILREIARLRMPLQNFRLGSGGNDDAHFLVEGYSRCDTVKTSTLETVSVRYNPRKWSHLMPGADYSQGPLKWLLPRQDLHTLEIENLDGENDEVLQNHPASVDGRSSLSQAGMYQAPWPGVIHSKATRISSGHARPRLDDGSSPPCVKNT
jgi:hypothetical protein